MALTKVTGSVIKDSVSLSGNVSVGGTLTYQDVTNVDALGIGTFRTGIKVLAGQVDVGSNIKLGNAGVITATSFVGSGANLTGISQVGGATGADFNDNVKVRFGASNDLQLFHATAGISTIMHFHSGGEPLHITSNGDIKFKVAADNTGGGGENGLIIKSNGAVELYHNNVKKFETAVDRVNVTGHMVIVDGSRIYITNGFGNGAASIRNEAGNTAGNMVFTTRTAGGSDTSRAMFTTDGHFIPYANSTYDLGNTATRWRNAYVNDMHFSNEGSDGNDIDGT